MHMANALKDMNRAVLMGFTGEEYVKYEDDHPPETIDPKDLGLDL